VIALKWHENPRNVNAIFPTTLHQIGKVLIPSDRIYLVVIAIVATAALWAASKYTPTGLAIRASAENQRAAATLGWSPHVLATISWALGAGLAGAAGILIAPVTGINPEEMPFFILPVLAAALVGGFTSFWITLLASFAIGITQSEFIAYVSDTGYTWGLKQTLPFLIIIVLLMIRGEGLPVRGQVVERMAELGSGKVRWGWLSGIAAAFVLGQVLWFDVSLQAALTVSFGWAIVMLSVVVLLGYTGQLSLAQFALAGIASLVAARLVGERGWPIEIAAVVAVAVTIPVGLLFAIPALRTRGINLAVVTLGLAMGVNAMIFTNTKWVGASGFTAVPGQHLFGLSIDPITHVTRYGIVAFVALVLCALSVASVRRGVVGRRLIAVRTNERAAAALGISVFGVKLYAFALGAAIAGVGGVILTFRTTTVAYSDYTPLASILAVAYTVIGGIGYVLGAPFGSQLVQGGFGTWLLDSFPWWGVLVLGMLLAALGVLLARSFVAAVRGGTKGIAVRLGIGTALLLGLGTAGIVLAFGNGPGDGWTSSVFTNPNPSWLTVIGGITVTLLIVLHPDGAVSVNAELFERLSAALGRVTGRVEREERVAPLPDAVREPVEPATLEASNITVRFGGVVAVNDASVTVAPGEIVGLIGPNGAGKTTLVDAITGFVKPATGSILVNGKAIDSLPVYKRARSGVSRSFQQLELFESSTVRENLMVASDGYSHLPYATDIVRPTNPPLSSTAVAAVKELALDEYLDVRVSDLPYGRRRLVAIARAIAVAPSILLLDEPAAGLSGPETAELATVVRRLAQEWKLGILVIEHDMSFVMSVCDRITVLEFGRQIATGTPAEIRADPAVIAAYLGEGDDEEAAAPAPPPRPHAPGGTA
jgi:ABC-type branched-subunit amino acid transport system ATPase component/ABC-type branched-subunit amino acid transport system permease subunit